MRTRNLVVLLWLALLFGVVLPAYIWLAAYRDGKVAGLPLAFPALLLTFVAGGLLPLICNHRGEQHATEGLRLFHRRDFSAARAAFERARGLLHADDPHPHLMLGLVSLQLWDVRRALRHFEDASRRGHQPEERWLAHALLGEPPTTRSRHESVLTRLVWACRARDFETASALIASGPRPEGQGKLAALWDMLACWTAVEQGRPPPAASPLALFEETSPERLRAVWPELVDFALTR
ncbi:MAG: hypothetical protein ACOZQL_02305 [Myxococcota bacterium]